MIDAKSITLALGLLAWTLGCAALQTSDPIQMKAEPEEGQALDQDPVLIRAFLPAYPEFARQALIEGKVVLRAVVGEDGRIQKVEAIHPITGLTESAEDAVIKSEFRPAQRDGHPVPALLKVAVTFQLEGVRP